MAQCFHDRCNRGLVMVSELSLVIMTFKEEPNGLGVAPGTMDIRLIDSEGNLRMSDEGAKISPHWFCPTCKTKVPEEEVLCDCFGCGGKHPIAEMVSTIHTNPVRMDCYAAYRDQHPDEPYPKKPVTMSLAESLRNLVVKF